jgi:hypothetical protein
LPANLRLDRILLLAALGLFGLLLLGVGFGKLLNRPQTRTVTNQVNGSPVAVEAGFAKFAQEQQKTVATNAPLTKENAPEIVKAWLSAKAAAMGETHQIDQLDKILVDPALSQMKGRAEDLKSNNSYWKLEHPSIEIASVTSSEPSPDSTTPSDSSSPDSTSNSPQADSTSTNDSTALNPASPSPDASSSADTNNPASIEAVVTEKADLYTNGQLDTGSSYNSTVRVRYDLERQDGEWRIRDMQILQQGQ